MSVCLQQVAMYLDCKILYLSLIEIILALDLTLLKAAMYFIGKRSSSKNVQRQEGSSFGIRYW